MDESTRGSLITSGGWTSLEGLKVEHSEPVCERV